MSIFQILLLFSTLCVSFCHASEANEISFPTYDVDDRHLVKPKYCKLAASILEVGLEETRQNTKFVLQEYEFSQTRVESFKKRELKLRTSIEEYEKEIDLLEGKKEVLSRGIKLQTRIISARSAHLGIVKEELSSLKFNYTSAISEESSVEKSVDFAAKKILSTKLELAMARVALKKAPKTALNLIGYKTATKTLAVAHKELDVVERNVRFVKIRKESLAVEIKEKTMIVEQHTAAIAHATAIIAKARTELYRFGVEIERLTASIVQAKKLIAAVLEERKSVRKELTKSYVKVAVAKAKEEVALIALTKKRKMCLV